MLVGKINEIAGKKLCEMVCKDNKNVRRGVIDRRLRDMIVALSVAIELSEGWCPKMVYEYECWLRNNGVL